MTSSGSHRRSRPKLPRGFQDSASNEVSALSDMASQTLAVYERYGYQPIETPIVEYSEFVHAHLPDIDSPGGGIFGWTRGDEPPLCLRYDHTAPLGRYVSQHFQTLRFPFKSARMGWTFRDEKPGPGRFRQFFQADADIVGSESIVADAEMCVMAVEVLEALGIPRERIRLEVGHRKWIEGLLEKSGATIQSNEQRLTVMRALDKLDRLGPDGVRSLLGEGRKDPSGDFTPGAGLPQRAVDFILDCILPENGKGNECVSIEFSRLDDTGSGECARRELTAMQSAAAAMGVGSDTFRLSSSIVRGLAYYTGPVFEVQVCPPDTSRQQKFGSVAGGGRYDRLIRGPGDRMLPATGVSVGLSRLGALLAAESENVPEWDGPVIITRMDQDREALEKYVCFARQLRGEGIQADIYMGSGSFKAQMKYADHRRAPCVLIQGTRERDRDMVMVKEMALGRELARSVATNQAWRGERPAQVEIPEVRLIDHVREIIARTRPAGDGSQR